MKSLTMSLVTENGMPTISPGVHSQDHFANTRPGSEACPRGRNAASITLMLDLIGVANVAW
jgi:hypothetical protein